MGIRANKLIFFTIILTLVCGGAAAGVRFILEGYQDTPYVVPSPPEKTCEEEGYVSSLPDGLSCEIVMVGSKKCYNNCEEKYKTCAEAGLATSVPTNNVCEEATINGNKCYKNCVHKCIQAGYLAAVPSGKTCENITYRGATCYQNCMAKSCAAGGFAETQVSGKVCLEILYDSRPCYDCYTREEICNSGGYWHYVPTNNRCEEVKYHNAVCYANCKIPVCEDYGYYATSQNDMLCTRKVASTSLTNCYECRDYKCSDGGYSDTKPAGVSCEQPSYQGLTCYNLSSCIAN